MQIASTQTFALDPAVSWRLVGIAKEIAPRREAPMVAPFVESPPDRVPALEVRTGARLRREWIRPGLADAIEFAMFAATLAAIGFLHLQLALLP